MLYGSRMSIRYKIFLHFTIAAALSLTAWSVTAQNVIIDGGAPEQLNAPVPTLAQAVQSEAWQPYTGQLQTTNAEIWVRYPITLKWIDSEHANNPLALSLRVKGLYEAYWDGKLIGSNSYLGKAAPEFSRLMLPVGNIADGQHWLYMRIKGAGLSKGDNIDLGVYPTDLSSDFFGVHFTVIIVFMVTVSSYIASGYFLYIGWRGSDVAIYRIAALTTFLTGSIIFLDRAKFLTPYPYVWQSAVEISLAIMTISFLLAIAYHTVL